MGGRLNLRCRTADTEEPGMWRANYRLYSNFQLCRGLVALAPIVQESTVHQLYHHLIEPLWRLNEIIYTVSTIQHILFQMSLFFFLGAACRILVPWPGIKPVPPAMEAQSLNHWTTREVPQISPFHRKNTGQIGDLSYGPRKSYCEGPSHHTWTKLQVGIYP